MRHWIKKLIGSDPDPIHSGDMRSWFFHYKWRPEDDDETWYPLGEDEFPEIGGGDVLWFCLDGTVIGSVRVIHVFIDDMNDRKEVRYNTNTCKPTVSAVPFKYDGPEGELTPALCLNLVESFFR
jgi:hypothetical protein